MLILLIIWYLAVLILIHIFDDKYPPFFNI